MVHIACVLYYALCVHACSTHSLHFNHIPANNTLHIENAVVVVGYNFAQLTLLHLYPMEYRCMIVYLFMILTLTRTFDITVTHGMVANLSLVPHISTAAEEEYRLEVHQMMWSTLIPVWSSLCVPIVVKGRWLADDGWRAQSDSFPTQFE